MDDEKLRVLFVGERHAVRSVIAERVLTARTHGAVEAVSAGIDPGPVHPLALQVLRELAIDATNHQPRSLAGLSVLAFDLIVTFGDGARERCSLPAATTNGTPPEDPATTIVGLVSPLHVHWNIAEVSPGPSRDGIGRFRLVRDEIIGRLDTLMRHGYLDALRERKRRAMHRIDRSALGLTAMDASSRFFLFNSRAERITGRTRTEVLGRDCRQVFPPHGLCGSACLFADGEGCPLRGHEHIVGLGSPAHSRAFRVEVSSLQGLGMMSRATVAVLHDTNGAPPAPRSRHFHGMVGRSPALAEAIALIRQVARSDYPVLITGESGTGKELAAQAIHLESRRRGGPFVPINCGALPEHILESELFGHVKGAFTGAIRDKKGRFELADGGTLLLDEVGELSPAFQVKLLRVLQEKRFEPVGGERSIMVDVRVVSSTNRDLRVLVKEGAFREDLFYRLAVVPLGLPPLRERAADLPGLVDHVLAQIRKDTGAAIHKVSPTAMARLSAHPWPGNIRELINALQYASVHCSGEEIGPEHLPPEISGQTPVRVSAFDNETADSLEAEEVPPPEEPPRGGAAALTPERVAEAIRRAGGNKLQAARLLGIGRATLYRYLASHDPAGTLDTAT
ncbi:MAG: sigma 54-interacting transcriptional regulator [Candidatus Eisenbacteria bacterium]|jgi:transcriptional regulator with PAS, ATPase and Fis domain|nr:sigma 54-interacting transcriptional regulator [Candidatus Eisenbacteria bacterium]